MSWYNMLKQFHKACGTVDPVSPTIPPSDKKELRRRLLEEEFEELMGNRDHSGALDDENIEDIAKELCDLIYVAIGCGLAYGINMDKAFEEVHRSNMSKIPADGKILKRPDGKVIKPSSYRPANMGIIWESEEDGKQVCVHYADGRVVLESR